MKILVINCGSSSIKYKLYDMTDETELAAGLIERMNQPQATIIHQVNGKETRFTECVPDAKRGVQRLVELLTTLGDPAPLVSPDELLAVGHRVVHGGEAFSESVIVDDKVLAIDQGMCPLAPLHNPANLAGLLAAMEILPGKPQVAVFDTAFFQTLPPAAYTTRCVTSGTRDSRVRRYGFHGSSHRYVAMMAAQIAGQAAAQPDHASLGQRLQHGVHQERPGDRPDHGPDPAGRAGHGHAQRRL